MSRIAGIIYPNAFQVTDMIGEMQKTLPSQTPFHYFRHKNLELGGWDTGIATYRNISALLKGEITNRDSLCKELKILSTSDAELVAHLYQAFKESFLEKLEGEFALAVFDEEKGVLFLAGERPLYWASCGEYWLFSTEIKGLIATGIVPQTPSREGLASYLHFGFIPQDLSPIEGVNKLLPSHYLKVDLLTGQTVITQYKPFKIIEAKTLANVDPDTLPQTIWNLDEPLAYPQDPLSNPKTSLAHFLAHLSPTMRDSFLLPFLKRIRTPYLYRILRNISLSKEQLSSLTERALFEDKIRKKAAPALYGYFDPEAFIQRFPFKYQMPQASYNEIWLKTPRFRTLFELLLKGRLVDEGIVSGRWIRQQLGYPYLIPRTFKQLWALVVLETWFRLYIGRPISPLNPALTTEELLEHYTNRRR